MDVASTVLRNSMAGIGAQVIVKALSFTFSVMVVRQLGVEQFGQYAAVLAFGAIFVFLADLGLGGYMVREVSRNRPRPDGNSQIARLFGAGLALRAVLAIVAGLLMIVFAILTNRPVPMIVGIALGALGLFVYSIEGTCESVLAGFERLDISAIARVANQAVFVVGGTIVLLVGTGYYGLVGVNVFGATLMGLICWRATRRLGVVPSGPQPSEWPTLLRASAPFAVIAGALGLSYKFDSVLLNVMRGDVETGYYNAAYGLVFASAFISNSVNTALYPTLSRQVENNAESLARIYGHVLRYLMIAALPIAFGGWALADQVVMLLFGLSYAPAAPALAILVWVVPLMFASELLGYIVVVRGSERRVARAVVVSTAVGVGCNLLLVPWLGFHGAALMTVATEALLVSQYTWYLRKELAQIPWNRTLARPFTAALLMGLLMVLLRDQPVPLIVLIAGATYSSLLLLFGVLGHDDLHTLRSMMPWQPSAASAG
jgi:O-antigen/teichoic acid export membrane protein